MALRTAGALHEFKYSRSGYGCGFRLTFHAVCTMLSMQQTHQTHQIFSSHPESPVINGQKPGIGRLNYIGGFLIANNLGRNIAVLKYSGGELNCQAMFAESAYGNGDERSEFDLDMHAFLRTSRGDVVAINHFGGVRMFLGAFGGRSKVMHLISEFKLPGDVERAVLCGDCIVSSSPSGYAVDDAAQPGIILTSSVYATAQQTAALESWGAVNNVAANENRDRLAVVAGQRTGLFEIAIEENGPRIKAQSFEWQFPFVAQLCAFINNEQLLLAGHAPVQAGDQDWDELKGGGFAVVNAQTGELVVSHELGVDLAWGNGAVPLVLNRRQLLGVTRQGALHSWNILDGQRNEICGPTVSLDSSLGMGHCVFDGMSFWAGFNRGEYVLHRYSI
jgi:hypothetical protein